MSRGGRGFYDSIKLYVRAFASQASYAFPAASSELVWRRGVSTLSRRHGAEPNHIEINMLRKEMKKMSEIGSSSRVGDYTEVHKCRGCQRAFWAKRSWNGVTVICPHCKKDN